jgi:tetratricopeptide (TPR) repeat protein
VRGSAVMSAQGYYVLLAILGLAAAAFLFGALRSTARLTGTQYGYAADLGGPVVIAVLLVYGGFYFTKQPVEFWLTVRLKGDQPITDAADTFIWVDLDARRERREFSTLGEAVITSIPARFRNSGLPIEFQSKVYRLKEEGSVYRIPDNAIIYLNVLKLTSTERQQNDICDGSPVVQLRNLGWAAFQKHNYEAAERIANTLQKCDKNDYVPYNILGAVAFYRQIYDRAAELFQQAVDLKPAMPDLTNNLADALTELALQSAPDKKTESLAKALALYELARYEGDFLFLQSRSGTTFFWRGKGGAQSN